MHPTTSELAAELRAIHAAAPDRAAPAIEEHLARMLMHLDAQQRAQTLRDLAAEFAPSAAPSAAAASAGAASAGAASAGVNAASKPPAEGSSAGPKSAEPPSPASSSTGPESAGTSPAGASAATSTQAAPETALNAIDPLVTLLLGRSVSAEDPEALARKLAASLNTVFDILNELLEVIDTTLTGSGVGEETIRRFIGGRLVDEQPQRSLEDYLGRIKTSFLTAHQAYQEAHQAIVDRILAELAPERLAPESALKIKTLRQAEAFANFEHRYTTVAGWAASSRAREDFLRAFEKACSSRLDSQK